MLVPLRSERLRRALGGRAALLVVLLVWPILLVSPSGPSMTDSVLLAAVRLVTEGTLTLADDAEPERVFLTRAFDLAVHEGRVYSGVGPGASLVAAPFYLLSRPFLGLFSEDVVRSRRVVGYYAPNSRALGEPPAATLKDTYLLQILLVILLVAPLYALFLVRLEGKLLDAGAPRAQAALVVLAVGLGSMALYYSTMYSRQALAYLLVWHAALSLWNRDATRKRTCLLAGVGFGAAVAVDYPSALAVGLVLAFILPRLGWASRLRLLAPLGIVVALLGLYHWAAFGSPLSTPYQNRFWLRTEVAAERGLVAFEEGRRPTANPPSASVMLELGFGFYKGLFVYSPVLLLGLLGHVLALFERERRRGAHLLSLAVVVAYLVFNSTLGTHVPEYGHHFWGGLSMLWGPRHLFAVLAFLAWGLVGLDWRSRAARFAGLLAVLVSSAINVTGAMFSDVMMSSYAFSRDLRYPIGYAFRLLAERGPRAPLLDAYGVDPRTQAAALVGLGLATAVVLAVRASLDHDGEASGVK